MPTISELPDTTLKLLGSPLVITTPTTLVKELLDNAIDAKATSVEVRISPNTIERIEVKDNGIGIHPDDYDSLGRRGHTSKLRTFEELSTHGCKTLGFRGEALAAANTLGQVNIITKTADDPVGATLQLVRNNGGIERQQKVSAPVGTTVRISGLFGRVPVREQVAIRDSAKTLDKIRDLLKTYAMARPSVKLSLMVLQNPNKNWSYSPNQNAGVKEAILQVAGREVAANCIENIHHVVKPELVEETSLDETTTDTDGYTFEVYVMDPNGDPCKVPKHHYFSVDNRPISTKKGAMKKILEKYVKAVEANSGHPSDREKGYFIRLNIICPRGSYDVNVEPSKDEILFVDEKYLLDTLEHLWQSIYKPLGEAMSKSSVEPDAYSESHNDVRGDAQSLRLSGRTLAAEPSVAQLVAAPRPTGDVCLLNPHHEVDDQEPFPVIPPRDHQTPHQEHSQSEGTRYTLGPRKTSVGYSQATSMPTSDSHRTADTATPKLTVNMSTDLNEYVENPQVKRAKLAQPISGIEEDTVKGKVSPMQNLNPFVIAKMTAPACPQRGNTTDGPAEQIPILSNRAFTPPTPEPPILRHLGGPPGDLDLPPNQRLHMEADSHHRGIVPGGPYRSPMSSPLGAASQGLSKVPAHHNMVLRHRRPQPPWTPPCSVPRPTARQEQENPPKSRLKRGPDSLEQTRISFKKNKVVAKSHHEKEPGLETGRQLPTGHINDGPGSRDDFEAIFSSARQHLHRKLPQSSTPMANNQRNDTKNPFSLLRSTSVQCDAQPPTVDKEPIKTIIPAGDPRAYLLRRQKSIGAEAKGGGRPRFRRLKSSMLPLENTPEEDQTYLLVYIMQCRVRQLQVSVQQIQPYDKYMIEGELEDAIDMDLCEGRRVESRLKTLLSEHVENQNDGGNDVELDLNSLLKGKGRATGI